MTMQCEVTIRDGRINRDPARIDDNGHGAVLGTASVDEPPNVGDVIALHDGTRVKVIGTEEHLAGDSWRVTVHIGTLFDGS